MKYKFNVEIEVDDKIFPELINKALENTNNSGQTYDDVVNSMLNTEIEYGIMNRSCGNILNVNSNRRKEFTENEIYDIAYEYSMTDSNGEPLLWIDNSKQLLKKNIFVDGFKKCIELYEEI